MTATSKKLSSVDIQRQLRHKIATRMAHNLKGLGNERNAANVIEKIQGHPRSIIVIIRQRNNLAS